MNNATVKTRLICAVIPAFLLAISVGQIYAFTNFATQICDYIGQEKEKVQFAFSLGIFFLGMGAAFFGKIVEKNIRLATFVGTFLFLFGLLVTSLGISTKSLLLIYLGYGFLIGTGTGIIYITPVKTMMLWFPKMKAIAAAVPIISFGLGSTLSTLLYKGVEFPIAFGGLERFGITKVFAIYAAIYFIPMLVASMLLKKPVNNKIKTSAEENSVGFSYRSLLCDKFFVRAWLFMFLNISSGLCLIPLAKQMMKDPSVGYSEGVITSVIALCGLMNGGGRFVFAFWSDRLAKRINILLIILSISLGVMLLSIWPVMIGVALLVINGCYGAGFSVIPAILADHYGINNISKIHGAVLSAWGVAGLVGNQLSLLVSDKLGFGNIGVVIMLCALYLCNLLNASTMRDRQNF